MSIVDISHKWQEEKTQHSCYFFPDSNDEQDKPLYCTCRHMWVTFSEEGSVMLVGADKGYDPINIQCEAEDLTIQLPDDDHIYVRVEEGKRG